MAADGFTFTRSPNGVWLTAAVPPRYLSVSASSAVSD
jgi:RNA:NAD 2'-phosphotransferase (TPT1/KptA family)